MGLYEALYGKSYRSPLCWAEPDENVIMGPLVIEETIKNITAIHDRRKTVQSGWKSSAILN